jgi:protein-L-isoaspartate O-methyltransferase
MGFSLHAPTRAGPADRENAMSNATSHVVSALGIPCFIFAVLLGLIPNTARPQETHPPADLQKLEEQFDAAVKAEDYGKAIEIGDEMQLIALSRYVETLFNVARMHDRLGHREQAFSRLEKAAEANYWQVRLLLRDTEDFKGLKEEERFKSMMKAAWLKNYIWMLERPERADFQKPAEVMAALALRPGERVADIGAGSGYFTIPMAKAVGPTGKVYATDLHQELLDRIVLRAREEGLDNVITLKVEENDPMLPEGIVDTIIMVDAYHYLQDRIAYNKKLCACLAPGGRVIVIDSIPRPAEQRVKGYPQPHVEISRETLDAEMAAAGLAPSRTHDFLPEQYFVEYKVK